MYRVCSLQVMAAFCTLVRRRSCDSGLCFRCTGCAACDIVALHDSVMKSRQRMLELTIRSVASCLVCSCRNVQCALKCASTMSDLVG